MPRSRAHMALAESERRRSKPASWTTANSQGCAWMPVGACTAASRRPRTVDSSIGVGAGVGLDSVVGAGGVDSRAVAGGVAVVLAGVVGDGALAVDEDAVASVVAGCIAGDSGPDVDADSALLVGEDPAVADAGG